MYRRESKLNSVVLARDNQHLPAVSAFHGDELLCSYFWRYF